MPAGGSGLSAALTATGAPLGPGQALGSSRDRRSQTRIGASPLEAFCPEAALAVVLGRSAMHWGGTGWVAPLYRPGSKKRFGELNRMDFNLELYCCCFFKKMFV